MKKLFLFGGMALMMSMYFTSCTEDEVAENEEIINDDQDGDDRAPFVGDWKVVETGKQLGTRNYWVSIKKDDAFPSRVNMYNFYMLGETSDSVIATISTVLPGVITVTDQTRKGNFISGSGKMEGSTITIDFTVDDGSVIDTLKAVFTK